jgi:hypothetical protein
MGRSGRYKHSAPLEPDGEPRDACGLRACGPRACGPRARGYWEAVFAKSPAFIIVSLAGSM